MTEKDLAREETKRQIIAAAASRFSHYGYQKTTMAEIARDLNMSAGNIYRFFASKVDIAQDIALSHEDQDLAQMEAIVSQDLPAVARLTQFLRDHLDHTYGMIAESRKVFEVAQAIVAERPEFGNRRLKVNRTYMMRILADGVKEGVFAPMDDLEYTAEMIQAATMKFHYPQLWNCNDLDMLRRELAGVTDILLNGLRA